MPDAAFKEASLWHVLSPKLQGGRRRAAENPSVGKTVLLLGTALVFWLVLYRVIVRMLEYFRATAGIGDVLATKLLGLILLGFLSVLILSNLITALSSFFLSKDIDLLVAAPIDGLKVYGARLLETVVHSSWMVALMMVPVLTAYASVLGGGWAFVGVAVVAMSAFFLLPGVVGAAVTLVLVNVFPARRARDLLALIALIGAAALLLLFRLMRPEQLARPEGFRNLVDFVAVLDTPSAVWLPSDWAAEAMTAMLAGISNNRGDLFPLLLLVTTAAALFVVGAWMHGRYYLEGLSRAQEGGAVREESRGQRRLAERLVSRAPVSIRAMVSKDVRTFFRDATQWSQLILIAVLLVIYVYNIKVLPLFQGEEVGFFLVNVISFLNMGLVGFVIAAIAARFVFPAVSLEGRTFWLLKSSPFDLKALLWTKYWMGAVPLVLVAALIVIGTNIVLRVEPLMMVISVGTMLLATLAVTALALCFGALFPRFRTENAADIATGFGGLVFMMSSISYLALIIGMEAWPVYMFLDQRARYGTVTNAVTGALVLGVAAAILLSVVVIIVSLAVARRRVGEIETS
jgi:ABC-2 type transport system permease protein